MATPEQTDTAENAKWRRFFTVFMSVLLGGAGVAYIFILLVDPYDDVAFSLPLDRQIVSISQRHMYPQIVRSRRFDALIIGDSTSRLLDPELLDREFNVRFANLAMDAATAWEQQTMLDFFIRKAGPPKAVIVGITAKWCDPEAAGRNRITFRGFPDWLYDDNPWNDYLYLFNSGTVEIAGRMVGNWLGLYRTRVRYDGYHVFVPPESEYDPVRAAKDIWGKRTATAPPDIGPPLLSEAERRALSFPALHWLDTELSKLPAASLKMLAIMPVHVAAQPWPGTHDAAVYAECKARIIAVARARGAALIDWQFNSALTHDDNNYWDKLHYRVPIATLIAKQLAEAVLHGRASENDVYRILVPR